MTTWLPGAHVLNLSGSRGNGPFQKFLGVALHVNVDENGTSDSFWQSNSGQVTPNFQVFKSAAAGGIHQLLPFNWQPWCQIEGNFNYAAIETAGMPNEPLTDYQMKAIASILKVYHDEMGMPLKVINSPGQAGFGTHQMGGQAWGGHACPGDIRAGQRQAILNLVSGSSTDWFDMATRADLDAAIAAAIPDIVSAVLNHKLADPGGKVTVGTVGQAIRDTREMTAALRDAVKALQPGKVQP